MRVQLNNGIGSKRKLIIYGLLIFSFWVGLLFLPSPTNASGLTPDTLIHSKNEPTSTPIKLVDDTGEDDSNGERLETDLLQIEQVVETTNQEGKRDQDKSQSDLKSVLDTRIIEAEVDKPEKVVDQATNDLQLKVDGDVLQAEVSPNQIKLEGSDHLPTSYDLTIETATDSIRAPIVDDLEDHIRSGAMLPKILDHAVISEIFKESSFPSSVLKDVISHHHNKSDRKQPAPIQHMIIEQTPPLPRSPSSEGPAFGSVFSIYALYGEQIVPNAGTESAYDHQVRLAADQWSQPPPFQPRIDSFFSQITSR